MVSIPVLASKLFVPARRPQLVARPRVAERLGTTLGAGHRLTLVSAPPGFGKTTLLRGSIRSPLNASSSNGSTWQACSGSEAAARQTCAGCLSVPLSDRGPRHRQPRPLAGRCLSH
jgi:ATP/maltotriose-dependent transcriptional regulator MalT